MFILFPTLLILLINFWIFVPFFNLGLFGDDWLTIFRYSYYLDEPKHLGPYSTEYFNNFTYFLNAYGSQDTITALLYKTFGQESNIYFLISYALRIGAGLSIYLPAFLLTKNKLAAWFAVFFFLFSSTGLVASSWVFNMPSYLAIIFFSFLLYCYLKHHQDHQIKTLLLSYFFFGLTFLSSPIRAHGLIPFFIFLEILWFILERNRQFFKLGLRLSGFFVAYFVIYFLGFKETISGSPTTGFIISLKDKLQLLSQNNFNFLFYPIATLGNILIPDSFFPHGWQIITVGQYLFRIVLPIFLIYTVIVFIFTHYIGNLNRKFLSSTVLVGLLWTLSVLIIFKLNPATFSNANNTSSLLTGGYLLIIVLSMLTYLKSNHLTKNGLLIALGWTIISNLYPWWQINTSAIFPTTHRYLIVSSVGMSLLLAKIISFGTNTKGVFVLLATGSIFLIIHAFSTRNFLTDQYQTHNRNIVSKIWSAMPNIPEVGKTVEPLVFYFEGDGTNGSIIGDSITFGFPPHMALLYAITEEGKIPIPMSDFKQVQSAVLDGKSLVAYGYPTKPIPIENIYAFRLEGQDRLINITNQIRDALRIEGLFRDPFL